jgi:hypothetical protein
LLTANFASGAIRLQERQTARQELADGEPGDRLAKSAARSLRRRGGAPEGVGVLAGRRKDQDVAPTGAPSPSIKEGQLTKSRIHPISGIPEIGKLLDAQVALEPTCARIARTIQRVTLRSERSFAALHLRMTEPDYRCLKIESANQNFESLRAVSE